MTHINLVSQGSCANLVSQNRVDHTNLVSPSLVNLVSQNQERESPVAAVNNQNKKQL